MNSPRTAPYHKPPGKRQPVRLALPNMAVSFMVVSCVSQNSLSLAPEAERLHSAFSGTVAHWGKRLFYCATMEKLPKKFWSKVEKLDLIISEHVSTPCWMWIGAYHAYERYPSYWCNGKMIRAHRMILEISIARKLKPGEQACHKCDIPQCVNPEHLFAGTQLDNVADRSKKGRGSFRKSRMLAVYSSRKSSFNRKYANKTGHRGVVQVTSGRYSAAIQWNLCRILLGEFDTILEASTAYEAAKLRLFPTALTKSDPQDEKEKLIRHRVKSLLHKIERQQQQLSGLLRGQLRLKEPMRRSEARPSGV